MSDALLARLSDLSVLYELDASVLRVRTTDGHDVIREIEASTAPSMRRVVALAREAARAEVPVLVHGERGAGKGALARAIHAWSGRGSLVRVRRATAPGSEAYDAARTGTLMFDEIGDLPLGAQRELVRALADDHDARVIATTEVDLVEAVQAGSFRVDLHERLAVAPLYVPPLRERPSDIVPLATRWLARHMARTGRGPHTISPEAVAALEGYRWEGNVRQLVNVLERATILQPTGRIEVAHLGLPDGRRPRELPTFAEQERAYLTELMERAGGHVYGPEGAAARADLKPTTLHSKLKKHGLR